MNVLAARGQSPPPAAPAGAPIAFDFQTIGPPPFARPTITNVQIVDLDGDGVVEIVACDAQRQAVFAYRRAADGAWSEELLTDGLIAPAHATVVDLDQDGDRDVLVSEMGNLYPDDDVIGSLILLENDGGKFARRTLLDDVRRVVDAQPGDFDGDGDLDLAVAVFGYLRGQVLWLENRGDGQFRDHELLSAAGTIHVPVADYDRDGDLDIAAVVSQDDEEVWAFENVGGGKFRARQLWMTINFDIGTAGLAAADLDGDGDQDLLLPVGDNLEDSYSIPQPYHGCLWLENRGGWEFTPRRIATFPGTYAAAAGDLDGDGDVDAALVSMVNHWDSPDAPSLVWLENDGEQQFTQHAIATDPIMLVTVACGDIDRDGRLDLVAGGLHMHRPFDRLGRISAWTSRGGAAAVQGAAADEAPTDEAPDLGRPPLPNLALIDALTRDDLQALHDKLAAKLEAGAATDADWLELGQAYYAFGYFAASTPCFAEAAALDREASLPQFLLGASLARRGLLDEAIGELARALPRADAQQQAWIWHEIARCHLRREDEGAAEEALVRSGSYPLALYQLAKLRLRAERARDAVEPAAALLRLAPQAAETHIVNARIAQALGDVRRAQDSRDRAEYTAEALPPDPVSAILRDVRARYGASRRMAEAQEAIAQQRWQDAVALLEPVVAQGAINDAVVKLAGAEMEAGRPERTIELLAQAMNERGRSPVAMVLMGDACERAGRAEEAVAWWEAAAAVRSASSLHERLARVYDRAGRTADARRQRGLAREAAGVAYLRHANPRRGQAELAEAVAIDPELVGSWFYLGECRRLLGDHAGARDAYRRALAINPHHGRALARLDLLPQ